MLDAIRASYELYGFEPVETPFIEYTDALGKFLPDQDRPNEGVFSFQDDDEQWLSLRYDLTAPLARYVAENFDRLPKPYRSYRAGFVFRNEKPGPGRFRQFMQFDADTVGAASVAADAEICMMAADTLERLGIARGDYVIKVNNRKILDGVMEAIGLGGEENAGRRLIVLRAIDKLDRLGVDGVNMLLGPGRKDESGDFTKGAGLNHEQIEKVLVLFDIEEMATQSRAANPEFVSGITNGTIDAVKAEEIRAHGILGGIAHNLLTSATGLEGVSELRALWDICRHAGYGDSRIRIDPSVVRGLEYYTGPVFEAELTFGVKDERGNPVRFGSVGGGGRYDGLVGRFRNEPVPATGFSIGVSRLFAALKLIDSPDRARRRRLARPCRRAGDGSRPPACLPAHGVGPAQCRRARRTLSWASRHEGADEICRPPQRALCRHSGLRRSRQRRSADQGSDRGRAGGGKHRVQRRMEGRAARAGLRAGSGPPAHGAGDTCAPSLISLRAGAKSAQPVSRGGAIQERQAAFRIATPELRSSSR